MTQRWDDEITKFLDNQVVMCPMCPGPIKKEFDKKMGYYKCGGCGLISAPELFTNTGVAPLYWSMCHDCNKNNVTEKDQEPYWVTVDEKGKPIVTINKKQGEITCSNCGKIFKKVYPKTAELV